MTKHLMNSNAEIDYSILSKRIKRSETTNPQLVGKGLINEFIQSTLLTDEQISILNKLEGRQKSTQEYKYPYIRTKTGTLTHPHEFLYKYGISQQTEYSLVKIDLVTCLIQLIQVISGIKEGTIKDSNEEINKLSDGLALFLSGLMDTDEQVQGLLTKLVEINNPYLTLYINKAIDLTERGNITVMDAFNIERHYKELYPIEAIITPISYSLYTLQYIIVERLQGMFRRGEKRFACIDKYRLYYFIRNDIVDKFLESEFYLEGVKLNINFNVVKPQREVVTSAEC